MLNKRVQQCGRQARGSGCTSWAAEQNSWDSGLAAGGRHKGSVRFPTMAKFCPFYKASRPTLGLTQPRGSSTGCKIGHVKEWSYTSDTVYVFVVCKGTLLPLAWRRITGRVEERCVLLSRTEMSKLMWATITLQHSVTAIQLARLIRNGRSFFFSILIKRFSPQGTERTWRSRILLQNRCLGILNAGKSVGAWS